MCTGTRARQRAVQPARSAHLHVGHIGSRPRPGGGIRARRARLAGRARRIISSKPARGPKRMAKGRTGRPVRRALYGAQRPQREQQRGDDQQAGDGHEARQHQQGAQEQGCNQGHGLHCAGKQKAGAAPRLCCQILRPWPRLRREPSRSPKWNTPGFAHRVHFHRDGALGRKRPSRISRDSGFSMRCWIARLSGRAPNTGSKPTLASSASAAGEHLQAAGPSWPGAAPAPCSWICAIALDVLRVEAHGTPRSRRCGSGTRGGSSSSARPRPHP